MRALFRTSLGIELSGMRLLVCFIGIGIINPPRPVMTNATALILLPLGVQAPWPNMLLAASRSKLTPSRQRPEFYFCGIEDSCRQTARDLGCGRWKPRHGLPQSSLPAVTAEELVGGQNNPEDDAPCKRQRLSVEDLVHRPRLTKAKPCIRSRKGGSQT